MSSGIVSAKNQKQEKMKELKQTKKSEVINASAEDLWKIIGPGFANAYEWSTAIDHSAGSGAAEFEGATCSERSCELNAKGFSKIGEKLTEYDAQQKVLAYDAHIGLPGFVTYANNQWRVVELESGKSSLEMTITMRLKPFMGALMGGMFKKNLNNTIDSVLRDLKVYTETGEDSQQKKDRMAALSK